MNEHLQSFEGLNRRPIGRFLNSLETSQETNGHQEAFLETKDFVLEHRDLLHRRNISFIARAALDDSGQVSIPKDTPKYEDALWLELDHSENPYGNDERFIWRISAGREQYNLELRGNYWLCTYCEKDSQGSLLRRYPLYDDQEIAGIYKLIRTIVTTQQFKDNVEQLAQKKRDDSRELESLVDKGPISLWENKRAAALKSALFNAGFAAGSIDRTNTIPLTHSLYLECNKNIGRFRKSDV